MRHIPSDTATRSSTSGKLSSADRHRLNVLIGVTALSVVCLASWVQAINLHDPPTWDTVMHNTKASVCMLMGSACVMFVFTWNTDLSAKRILICLGTGLWMAFVSVVALSLYWFVSMPDVHPSGQVIFMITVMLGLVMKVVVRCELIQ